MTAPDVSAATILQEFRQRMREEAVADDLRIRFGVSGGVPGQRLERHVRLDAGGRATIIVRDDVTETPRREHHLQLDADEARTVLLEVGDAALHLRPRSRHRLAPDSLVGLVEVESGGRSARFVFAAAEEAGALCQRELASNELDRLLERLMALSHRGETRLS